MPAQSNYEKGLQNTPPRYKDDLSLSGKRPVGNKCLSIVLRKLSNGTNVGARDIVSNQKLTQFAVAPFLSKRLAIVRGRLLVSRRLATRSIDYVHQLVRERMRYLLEVTH